MGVENKEKHMAWRYEERQEGLIQGTDLPLLRHYLIDDEYNVEVCGGPTPGAWQYTYRDPDVEFVFHTTAIPGPTGTGFPSQHCEIILPRAPFISLAPATRRRIGRAIKDYLLNLHLMPDLITRGRRVERCWFGARSGAFVEDTAEDE